MIRSVIFDFDGTIADTFNVVFKLLKKYHKNLDLPAITDDLISDFREKGYRALLFKYKFELIKLPFIIGKIRKLLYSHMDEVKLFKGMKEAIILLKEKGYKLGILTTNSEENVKKFLKKNNIDFFQFINTEKHLLGKSKALKNLLQKYRLDSSEIFYIGDEVRDIDACKENRVKIIAVTWGFNKKEILKVNRPDYLIDYPKEILKIINKY